MTSCFALHHSCQRKNVFLASATAWAISMCYSSIGPLPVRHWKSENGCLWQNYIPTCLVWIPPWRWHAQCGTGPFQVNVFCAGWAWLVFHHWRWTKWWMSNFRTHLFSKHTQMFTKRAWRWNGPWPRRYCVENMQWIQNLQPTFINKSLVSPTDPILEKIAQHLPKWFLEVVAQKVLFWLGGPRNHTTGEGLLVKWHSSA